MSVKEHWLSAFSPTSTQHTTIDLWGRYETEWAFAFLKTQLIEVIFGAIIVFFWVRRARIEVNQASARQVVLTLLIASSITHPPLWFILPHIFESLAIHSYLAHLLIGEALVVLVEAWWYRAMLIKSHGGCWSSALALSVTLNSASALYGLYEQSLA